MNCPHCMNLIDPNEAWKSTSNRYFCSEFCADAEAPEPVTGPSSLMQYHAENGYLDRLQRLVDMRRSVQMSAA